MEHTKELEKVSNELLSFLHTFVKIYMDTENFITLDQNTQVMVISQSNTYFALLAKIADGKATIVETDVMSQ
jgi:hypothetical protein